MKVGVPKEIKQGEYRVAMTPAGVSELCHRGHQVFVEPSAGDGAGFSDEEYLAAGATLLSASEIFAQANLLVKVKEPQTQELAMLHPAVTLFTYLHLAASEALSRGLMESGCNAIAYETVTDDAGLLPLLAPMSEVAGRMAVQAGAHCLERAQGGRGLLLAGVPGVSAGHVVILGGGVVGENAARMALGLGAQVSILDTSVSRLRQLDQQYHGALNTVYSTRDAIAFYAKTADLVIGAVLLAGAKAPRLIDRTLLRQMKPGSVIVDVAIDQGGCIETSRATSHQQPTYLEEGVVHYCVANIPGAVPRTSARALTNATLPYILALADQGVEQAVASNQHLAAGVNTWQGQLCCQPVAEAFDIEYQPLPQLLRC